MQHQIQLSNEQAKKLNEIEELIQYRINAHEVPDYAEYVRVMFSQMETIGASIHHAATGLATESGELLSTSKKVWVYRQPLDVENLIEELGDLRFYYQALLNMLGINDAKIIATNMQKLLRRYPDKKFTYEHAALRLDKQGETPDRKFFRGE